MKYKKIYILETFFKSGFALFILMLKVTYLTMSTYLTFYIYSEVFVKVALSQLVVEMLAINIKHAKNNKVKN